MKQPEDIVRDVIKGIAEENDYKDYTAVVKPISSGGANYSSYLLLATVSAPGKDDLQLFAKVAAVGENVRSKIPEEIYRIEQYFYQELIPKYRGIEEKFNVPSELRLVTAKYYGISDEFLYETLVLENLSARGFQSFDRFKCIDWTYTSYCIKQLARLHALSIAYSKYYSEDYKNYIRTRFMEYPVDIMNDPIQRAHSKATKIIKEVNKERFVTFLEKPKYAKPQRKIFHKSEFSVIAHGDYRPSNMMHKVLQDGTMETIAVDYQTIQEAPPVIDVLYFILTGSDKEFRRKYMQKALELYYTELSAALRRFQLEPEDIYSQQAYERDIKEFLPYMFSYSVFILLIVTVDEAAAPTVDKDLDFEGFDVATSELFTERVNDLVDDCIAMGVL